MRYTSSVLPAIFFLIAVCFDSGAQVDTHQAAIQSVKESKAKTPPGSRKVDYYGNSEVGYLQMPQGSDDQSAGSASIEAGKKIGSSKFDLPVALHDKPGKYAQIGNNGESVVYSQMTPGTDIYVSQDYETALNTYDCQAADDFTVSGGPMDILIVRFYGAYSILNGPALYFNIYFYQNNAGLPGTLIESFTGVPYEVESGLYTCVLPGGPLTLGTGTYWISIQSRQNFSTAGQWNWTSHSGSPVGAEALWKNPGNGFGYGAISWTPVTDVFAGATGRDMTFEFADDYPPIVLSPQPFCQSVEGSFDANWHATYEMYLLAGETYNFSCCTSDLCCMGDGTGNIDFTMYNESMAQQFYIDGNAGCGFDASTYGTAYQDWSPPADGIYYLQVYDHDGLSGNFTLAYMSGGAIPLGTGPSCATVSGTIGPAEIDVYKLELSTSSSYNFSLCASDECAGAYTSAGAGDGDLTLYDRHGNVVFYLDGNYLCGYDASTWNSLFQDYIPAYTGCHYLVVSDFLNAGGTYGLASIQSLCLAPTGLSVSGITMTSATLEWVPGYDETQWTIEYGSAPFDPGTGAATSVTYVCGSPCNYFYSIEGLTEGENYQWSIRAECSSGYSSDWSTGFFTTECQLECPPGGNEEGEADIPDNGLDVTNGGCLSIPPVFTPISLGDTYCGKVNTYLYLGQNRRDTDWYRLDVSGANAKYDVSWTVEAEFPMHLEIIDSNGDDCDDLITLASGSAGSCEQLTISANDLGPGVYYFRVEPSVLSGLPAASGPHMYTATLTGTVTPHYMVTGNVLYYNTESTPLDEVKVTLSDASKTVVATSVSDADGFFELNVPSGEYSMDISTLKPRGGTGLLDIVRTRQHLLGLITLNPLQQLSADVDASGSVGLLDIVRMRQYLLGLISNWSAPDWVYQETTVNVTNANMDQDMVLLCSGDPDGTHVPPPGSFDPDDCEFAQEIGCGEVVSGETLSASVDGPLKSCTGASVGPDKWYLYAGTGDYVTASLCGGTDYDSKIDIYTGSCGSLVSVTCDDDLCGLASQVSWQSVSGTDYYIRVHGHNGMTGNFVLSVTCGDPSPYCEASGGQCDEYIAQVILNTINISSDCGSGGYQDYTIYSTDLSKGSTYSLTVVNGTSYSEDDLGVWIDWNQDGDFADTGENVVCEFDNGGQGTFSITVPPGAESGQTIMRLRIKLEGTDCGSSCGTSVYGEVEDYTLNILP